MEKCWERYGKKWLKPKKITDGLCLFMRKEKKIYLQDDKEYLWVLVPLFTVSEHEGLPILMEGSHLNSKDQNDKAYHPTVHPGQALMYDARIARCDSRAGGGVVFALAYDPTST